MKRNVIVFALVLTLLVSSVAFAGSVPIRLFVNGNELKPSVQPILVNGQVMVPLQTVADALGVAVQWDKYTNSVRVNSLRIPSELKLILEQDPTLAQILGQLGYLMRNDPSLAEDISQTIEKHYAKAQPQLLLPSQSQSVESTRQNIVKTAETQRQQVRASAAQARNQIEVNYQLAKSKAYQQTQEAIRKMREEFIGRGLFYSTMRERQEQQMNDAYAAFCVKLDKWRADSLSQIDAWEATALRNIDAWEQEMLNKLPQ